MPEGLVTLVLGGARSGKSRHAEGLVAVHPPPWTYLATAEAFDAEMDERIALHRARRDARWRTVDAPVNLAERLAEVPDGAPVLVDCLTVWLGNLLHREADLEAATGRLLAVLEVPRGPWVVVADETGLGIVPDNALSRRFRDAAGRLNQQIAALAAHVDFVVAGLALKVK